MKVKMTKYLKCGTTFKRTSKQFETEVPTEDFNLFINIMGFKATSGTGHYWRLTAYDEGETLEVMR